MVPTLTWATQTFFHSDETDKPGENMNTPISLDELLESQSPSFTATLEPISEKPTDVKVMPYRDDYRSGCSSSFELPGSMIRSIIPTGKYHYCCGKRLEVAIVELTEDASAPVAHFMKRIERPSEHTDAAPSYVSGENYDPSRAAYSRSRMSPGIVGR